MKLSSALKKARIIKKFTLQSLADKVGVSKQAISQFENELSKPKADVLDKLKVALDFKSIFPKGYEYSIDEKMVNEPEVEYGSFQNGGVPIYYADLSSGLFNNKNIKPVGWLNIPEFIGCDAIIRVKDDSMAGKMNERDWIGIKKVNDWNQWLPMGYMYAITTGDLELVRTIKKGSKPDTFKVVSLNKAYEDDEIPKHLIKEVWSIKTILPFSKIETLL
jgi:transcriptional regulator with XRE-family HTH domain